MATTTCIKCGGTKFETKPLTPKGTNYSYMVFQCANCGGAIGFTDQQNLGGLLEDRATEIASLREEVLATKRLLEHLAAHLMK